MNTLNTFFDHIYCINLKQRPDRWNRCVELFNKHDLTVERIEGIYGHDLIESGVLTKEMVTNIPLLPGEIGCLYSHYTCLCDIVNKGYKNALILEDDINILVDNINQAFSYILSETPNNWDMLYLGGNIQNELVKISPHIYKAENVNCAHAYGITNSYTTLISNIISSTPINKQIDVIYKENQVNNNCYISNPKLFTQIKDYSNIQNKIVDYSNVLD